MWPAAISVGLGCEFYVTGSIAIISALRGVSTYIEALICLGEIQLRSLKFEFDWRRIEPMSEGHPSTTIISALEYCHSSRT